MYVYEYSICIIDHMGYKIHILIHVSVLGSVGSPSLRDSCAPLSPARIRKRTRTHTHWRFPALSLYLSLSQHSVFGLSLL